MIELSDLKDYPLMLTAKNVMLVYGTKGDAVSALKKDFIQSVDYQIFPKNGERSERSEKGRFSGAYKIDYKLSVSCLEYFIVRKVRPVFEVYRQVFHKVIERAQLPQTYSEALRELANKAEENERLESAKQMLINHNEFQAKQLEIADEIIKEQAPKVEYTDRVLQSLTTYTMTQVAKELGLSALSLERILKSEGIMFKQSGQWLLYSKYADKGYTKPRTHNFTHSDGRIGTNTITTWTEKGRMFIHELLRLIP